MLARDDRINADALLKVVEADARAGQRGKLKIFFGSSAGVGKTYAMLTEAQRRRAEGVDVVIGVIVTHGRPETVALTENLPVIPLRQEEHKGIAISEFDLDAALARKPAVILVDELAHTNAPGSRHPKRWQDIEELLDAGIDVYTTLNVQHLESLNDVVAGITGVSVRETVPDLLFDRADDVVLVDIPPDELLRRLHEGKVYIAPGANERAMQNFFRKTNLLSLRELALRRTAEYVDADTDDERLREGMKTPNTVGDRLLVCVGPDRLAAKLVRTARRLAASLKAPWTAVYIEPPESQQNRRLREHVQQMLASAERNGAQIVNLSADRIGDELLAYSRAHGITKLVIGKPVRPWWQEFLRPNLVNHIIRNSGDMDVYVVTGETGMLPVGLKRRLISKPRFKNYILAALLAAMLTAVGFYLQPPFSKTDVAMLYLMGAVFASISLGRTAALFYTLASISCFNFFFIEPLFSFNIYDHSYWFTILVMAATSLVIASQSARLRDQADTARRRERKTQVFYHLTRMLAATREQRQICDLVIWHVEDALGIQAAIWLAEDGHLRCIAGHLRGDPAKEEVAARWSFDHAQPAGLGTNTLPSAQGYSLPLMGREKPVGGLTAFPLPPETTLRGRDMEMLSTMANLLAAALEREAAETRAEQTRVVSEQERMRNVMLSSISHDLRTPLATITGAAETLALRPEVAGEVQNMKLVKAIGAETGRLSRIVNNLLDMTRYEDGNFKLNLEPYFLPEIIGSALTACQEVLRHHTVRTHVLDDLPLVRIDGVLMTQLLTNLLENAAKHTPAGTKITLSAEHSPDGIAITVADNGPGIPDGKEEQIFKKFATYARGDLAKGTGLGLAICQAIASAHHGRIWAENSAHGGAVFHALLPPETIQAG